MRNVSNKRTSEITFCLNKHFPKFVPFFEIMWKETVVPERPWTAIYYNAEKLHFYAW